MASRKPSQPTWLEPALRLEIARLWPVASKLPLKPEWVEAMVETHKALKLSPHALVAGFAHAAKEGKIS